MNHSVASWAQPAANPRGWGPAQEGSSGGSSLPSRGCSCCLTQG